ncbi:putative ribonuclease H-like domain-containing protein [Tanacetum coccineum]
MTGNKCYLTEYKDYHGGFVSFRDGKAGISGKGKIKSGTLVFDDVYFCKELKYNLFSVSQICDKKNNVLFTDTECLVLSSDFKLLDESQVLLRVLRKDNIYSVDLKSVVPTKGLTCLFAKATIDESNLWHRRLGHINFKNMNKLVRGNLVRGLPSKIFELTNVSFIACQKGKQHKASYVLNVSPMDDNIGIFAGAYDDEDVGGQTDLNNLETTMNVSSIPITRINKDHPIELIIGDLHSAPLTRRMSQQNLKEHCLEPKKVIQALEDPSWIETMQEELLQFELQKVWTLVDLPNGKRAIGIKWIFRNKKDEEELLLETRKDWLHKTTSTPMEPNKALVKDEEADNVDVHLYRSMIISLMYLTASRPYITFVVCACARFQVTPKTSHLHVVKRIFRYLKGQTKLGLWKSTTGGCQFLGKRLISWQCKKQTIVANSTTEAEYGAAANCYGQVLWIQNQMLDYGFTFMNTKIYIDNESTICIMNNPKFHAKTKHIEIRHHFIRDSYKKRLIQVIKVHSDQNVVDLLTKAFNVSRMVGRTCRTKRGRDTKIPQSGGPPVKVGDEAVHKELG